MNDGNEMSGGSFGGRPLPGQGAGRIFGRPGVYHVPAAHNHEPSRWYGKGAIVESLCSRTSGIVYAEDTLANLFPADRLCKFCERRTVVARVHELETELSELARKFTLLDEEFRLFRRDAQRWADETYDYSMAQRIRGRLDA